MLKIKIRRKRDNKICYELVIPTDIRFISGKPANDEEFEKCVNLAEFLIKFYLAISRYTVDGKCNVIAKSTKETSKNPQLPIVDLRIAASLDITIIDKWPAPGFTYR